MYLDWQFNNSTSNCPSLQAIWNGVFEFSILYDYEIKTLGPFATTFQETLLFGNHLLRFDAVDHNFQILCRWSSFWWKKNRLSFFGSVVVDVATDVLKVNGSLGLTRGNNRCFMQKSLHKESLQRLEKETLYAHIWVIIKPKAPLKSATC